jgi:hypothetical protein
LTWGAFQQLVSVLLDDDKKPVILEIEGNPPVPAEIYASPDDAIARIDDLRAMNECSGGTQWRASFIEESLSLKRLAAEAGSDMAAAHRGWRRRRGRIDRTTLARLLDAPLSGSLLLARIGAGDRPILEAWPRRLGLYSDEALGKLIGRPFDEHPLHGYSVRATGGYREVHRSKAPRLDLIEAVIRPEGGRTMRLRYERLLLPWQAEDGTHFVGSLSRPIWHRASACPLC